MNSRLKMLILAVVLIAGGRLCWAIWDWSESRSTLPKKAAARVEPKGKAYLQITPEARVRLLEKVNGVQIGDTVGQVLAQLGRPSDEEHPTTTQPSDPSHMKPASIRVGATILSYYIRKKTKEGFDEEYDEHIHIFLDEESRVKQIYVKLQNEQIHIFLDENFNVQRISGDPHKIIPMAPKVKLKPQIAK